MLDHPWPTGSLCLKRAHIIINRYNIAPLLNNRSFKGALQEHYPPALQLATCTRLLLQPQLIDSFALHSQVTIFTPG